MDVKELFADIGAAVSAVAEVGVKAMEGAYDLAEKPGMQGAAELAGALFNGSAFTPYGSGQMPAQLEQGNGVESLFAGPDQGAEVQAVEPPLPTPQVELTQEIDRGGR